MHYLLLRCVWRRWAWRWRSSVCPLLRVCAWQRGVLTSSTLGIAGIAFGECHLHTAPWQHVLMLNSQRSLSKREIYILLRRVRRDRRLMAFCGRQIQHPTGAGEQAQGDWISVPRAWRRDGHLHRGHPLLLSPQHAHGVLPVRTLFERATRV